MSKQELQGMQGVEWRTRKLAGSGKRMRGSECTVTHAPRLLRPFPDVRPFSFFSVLQEIL